MNQNNTTLCQPYFNFFQNQSFLELIMMSAKDLN